MMPRPRVPTPPRRPPASARVGPGRASGNAIFNQAELPTIGVPRRAGRRLRWVLAVVVSLASMFGISFATQIHLYGTSDRPSQRDWQHQTVRDQKALFDGTLRVRRPKCARRRAPGRRCGCGSAAPRPRLPPSRGCPRRYPRAPSRSRSARTCASRWSVTTASKSARCRPAPSRWPPASTGRAGSGRCARTRPGDTTLRAIVHVLRAGGAAVLVDTKPVLIPVHATATAGYVWDRTKTFAGGLLTWITGLVGLLGALVAAGLVYRGRHRARAVRP